ncbi:MAG: hypothetical protein V4732_13745 [Pseudomonadota bacterium]
MSTLLCRIELNKIGGITITVDNKDGKITHTVVLNSDAITTTSKGDSATSTITQTPEKITMDCKTFELTADDISCKSSKTTSFTSGTDFSIKSDSNFKAEAADAVNVKGTDVAIKATDMSVKATSIVMEGTEIKLSGSAQISATAAIIKLQ